MYIYICIMANFYKLLLDGESSHRENAQRRGLTIWISPANYSCKVRWSSAFFCCIMITFISTLLDGRTIFRKFGFETTISEKSKTAVKLTEIQDLFHRDAETYFFIESRVCPFFWWGGSGGGEPGSHPPTLCSVGFMGRGLCHS